MEQLLMSAHLGDGCFYRKLNTHNYKVVFNSVNKEYLEMKKAQFPKFFHNITVRKNAGYSTNQIYSLASKSNLTITNFASLSLPDVLNKLSGFGLALWIQDDGTLHKIKNRYQLSTHSFTYDEHEKYILPFFNKLELFPKIYTESKSKNYYYLAFSVNDTVKLSNLITPYVIPSFSYKILSSETIPDGSRVTPETSDTFSEDMVRSL